LREGGVQLSALVHLTEIVMHGFVATDYRLKRAKP